MRSRGKNKAERSRYLLGIVWARTWVSRGPNYWMLDELRHMTDAQWDKLTAATRGSLKYGFGASTAYIKPSSAGPDEPWVKLGEVSGAVGGFSYDPLRVDRTFLEEMGKSEYDTTREVIAKLDA